MEPTRIENDAEKLYGVFVPALVPLDESQEIDWQSFDRLLDYLISAGVQGLWINGTTGDFHALRDEEQTSLIRAAVKRCHGGLPVIAHVGDTATRLVIEKARAAIAAGATYVSVILPYYLEYEEAELKRHFTVVAEAISRPIVLYQISPTKRYLAIRSVIELAQEGTAIAIKDSSSDLDYYRRLTKAARGSGRKLQCFHGAGNLAQVTLAQGGDGLVCAASNVVPHLFVELYGHARAGRTEQAVAVQSHINLLGDAIARSLIGRTKWAPTVAAYKWLLRELGVIASSAVFEPLRPLSSEETTQLRLVTWPVARRMIDASRIPAETESAARGLPSPAVEAEVV